MGFISRLIDVPSTDPEGARRGRLLNILLLGTFVLVVVGLILTALVDVSGIYEDTALIYMGGAVMLVGLAVIFAINRRGWVTVAAALFVLVFIVVLTFDDPEQVVNGRSLFLFAIPILMASVLLQPYAGFVAAAIISLVNIAIGLNAQIVPNLIAILGFWAIAMVSWLSARSLERALEDIRLINRELDERVVERTQDLAAALAREHAEANRREAILESIADGVVVFDLHETAVVANRALGQLLAQPVSQVVSRSIGEIMDGRVSRTEQEVVLDLLRAKEINRPPMKLTWDNKILSVSFAPVRDSSGQVSGTVAVFRDFTREAEIDRMKSDFVSIASHELRTPLTSIRGYIDLVTQETSGPINDQQRDFLHIANNNVDRLQDLVRDLLDVSRIESGRVDLDVQLVSLDSMLDTAVTSVRQQFDERGLTLNLDIPDKMPSVFADPNRIIQVMVNLLSNAYKYTLEGGATLTARQVENTVEIEIRDTGLGISEEDQEMLFTRFFRAGSHEVRRQAGTGLGLSITKSLVEMHGGQIWVDSKLGVGTTVTFSLPLPAGLSPKVKPAPERSALARTSAD
jgi:PAS domain S-box-containing protein